MIGLTNPEHSAMVFVLEKWRDNERFRRSHLCKLTPAMSLRLEMVCAIECFLKDKELLQDENQMNVLVEILHDFLTEETMNECRILLAEEELRRLEVLRTLFAKILANSPVHGRERGIGSIYLAPAELVKIGLHKMLEYPEIQLLNYARKHDGGMLRLVAQYMWHKDYEKDSQDLVH